MPDARFHSDVGSCVDAILADIGKDIILGLPLGLGKANHIANELFARAVADPSISLKIFTALTFEKPTGGPEIARRLVDPIVERLFGGWPDLLYAAAARRGALPANIEWIEFYVMGGRWLGVGSVQRHYVSVNYGEAARLMLDRGINVIAQLVAKRATDAGTMLSLSCNPDITLDLLPELRRRKAAGVPIVLAGQVNSELPFMAGDAALPASEFAHVLDAPAYDFPLFAPPKAAISLRHYAAALHIAPLIRDGGTLQVGIGSLGDAVAWTLVLRHRQNAIFRDTVERLAGTRLGANRADLAPFDTGLYAVTEMFADPFLELYHAGILKRRAADGALLHAAFFLGSANFYRALREMSDAERGQFRMTGVAFTNSAGGADAARKLADRQHARFINEGMIATLLGEVVSDTLDTGQVVSGVGGQFDFVAQARILDGARAILVVGATRTAHGRVTSNIRFAYGRCTIPRQFRDIIVTEYGAADVKGKSDRDCIAAMLAIADSRFQAGLLHQAKHAGKIEPDYEIPAQFRANRPDRLQAALSPARVQGLLPDYPFGTDLDPTEQRLAAALEDLQAKTATATGLVSAVLRSLRAGAPSAETRQALARLRLDPPATFRDRVLRRLLISALQPPVARR